MKLVLLLSVCFIAVTNQQGFFYLSPSPNLSPRVTFLPFYFHQRQTDQQTNNDLTEFQQEDENGLFSEAMARVKPQRRFFSNMFLTSLFNPFVANNLISTTTTTVFFTVSSTLTTAVVSSCIPALQFSTVAAVVGPPAVAATTFTTPCARRRRSVLQDSIEDHEGVLEPSPPEKMMASAVPNQRQDREALHPELMSSLESDIMDTTSLHSPAVGRRGRAFSYTFTVTFTSTLTTFSFASTIVRKTVNLAANNQLQCLPAGFLIC